MAERTPPCVEAVLSNPMGAVCANPHTNELWLGVRGIQEYGQGIRELIGENLRHRDLVIGGAAITNATKGLRHLGAMDPVSVTVEYWAVRKDLEGRKDLAVRLAIEDRRAEFAYDLFGLLAEHRASKRQLNFGGKKRMRQIADQVFEQGNTVSAHIFRQSRALKRNAQGVKERVRQNVNRLDRVPNMNALLVKLGRYATTTGVGWGSALVMESKANKWVTLVDVKPGLIQPIGSSGYEYIMDTADATRVQPRVLRVAGAQQDQEDLLEPNEAERLGTQHAIHARLDELHLANRALESALMVGLGKRI